MIIVRLLALLLLLAVIPASAVQIIPVTSGANTTCPAGQFVTAIIGTSVTCTAVTVPITLVGTNNTEATTTSVACVNLQSVTTSPSVATSKTMLVMAGARHTTADGARFGLTLNATEVMLCNNTPAVTTVSTPIWVWTHPLAVNYLRGSFNISNGITPFTADSPNAAITTIITRCVNLVGGTCGTTNMRIYALD